jgi:DNA replicative helicase MCM subunit Mcm2 (Cdc46/Mcm family)
MTDQQAEARGLIDELLKNGRDAYFTFLASAIAPPIKGHEDAKLAILGALLGGQKSEVNKRDVIHVLLVSEPSIYLASSSWAIQSIGKRVTLTNARSPLLIAGIYKEDYGSELHAGPVVLSDGGVAIIDEFEKLDPRDKSALYEIMQNQTFTISKFNCNTSMNVRTSIIAIAYPEHGSFIRSTPARDQLADIAPEPLLERFDAVVIIQDLPDAKIDKESVRSVMLARELMKQASDEPDSYRERSAKVEKMIWYARLEAEHRPITISPEAREHFKGIARTVRQIESLERFAIAFAKARLSQVADIGDAKMAERVAGVVESSF